MEAAPAVPAGVVKVTEVPLCTCKLLAGFPPTVIDVVLDRFVPVTVSEVPPAVDP